MAQARLAIFRWLRKTGWQMLIFRYPPLLVAPGGDNVCQNAYISYADDTLMGFIGTKKDAETIKEEFGQFQPRIEWEMSEEKTLIIHANAEKARFLNDAINRMYAKNRKVERWNGKKLCNTRTATTQWWYSIPDDIINTWRANIEESGIVKHRAELIHLSDYDIISTYEVELQGLLWNYRDFT